MPVPKMKPIDVTATCDASYAPCLITQRSVTGIALVLNNFILRCASKRQSTIESDAHSAEMVADCLAVEQVMDARCKLRILGARVENSLVLIGDNQSVITSC